MGATAAVVSAGSASAGAGAGVSAATSMFMTVGLGISGLAVTALLVFTLAYLNVLDNSRIGSVHLRKMLVVTVVPLALTFGGILLMGSLEVLGYLH